MRTTKLDMAKRHWESFQKITFNVLMRYNMDVTLANLLITVISQPFKDMSGRRKR